MAEQLAGVPVHSSELLTDRTPVPVPGSEADYPAAHHNWLSETPEAERDEGGLAISAAIEHFRQDDVPQLASDGADNTDTAESGGERQLLLITHAFVVGWFVRDALDAPAWRWLGLNASHAGLTVIRYPPGRPPQLVAFNDVGHLTGAVP